MMMNYGSGLIFGPPCMFYVAHPCTLFDDNFYIHPHAHVRRLY